MAEAELADQGIDTGVRRAQRHQLGMGFRQIFLVAVQGGENVLHPAHPRQQRRYVARDLLEPVGEIVLAVVGLEVVQRALELVLAVADFGEDRLDRAALIGDLADHLAQRLLAASDLGELVVHVGGFVAALLEQSALLGFSQLVMQGGDGLAGIALDQVLDGGVEMVLQRMGHDHVLASLPEAVAQRAEAPVLARQPPGGCADQRQRANQDRAGRDALRHRQAREPGGQVADIVTERLLGEKRDGSQQDEPGNQEKQPHREFLTPAHNIAIVAIGERNRDQGADGAAGWVRQRDPRLNTSADRWRGGAELAGFSRGLRACLVARRERSAIRVLRASRRPPRICFARSGLRCRVCGYNRNSLVKSPMPSIATVTIFTGSFITPTPTDVPTAMRSPGSRVMSWEILLTSSCALKIMSEIG